MVLGNIRDLTVCTLARRSPAALRTLKIRVIMI